MRPPWPGSNDPESFRPTSRLSRLTVKSPTTEAPAVASPSTMSEPQPRWSCDRGRFCQIKVASSATHSMPPQKPSQVLAGLISAASACCPKRRPAK
ncbi:MAG: hypothetical protein CM15mP92_1850 [Halieaceae bacterium]|nr:MAG: hypothetical protein CM15mP92_1850 [Halieaceae bacterium]